MGTNSGSGVPWLDPVQRSQVRWRRATFAVAGAGIVVCVLLLLVVRDLADQSSQQSCVDRIETEWEEAISNVVLASLVPDADPTVPPPPGPEAYADDVRRALDKLLAVDALCP